MTYKVFPPDSENGGYDVACCPVGYLTVGSSGGGPRTKQKNLTRLQLSVRQGRAAVRARPSANFLFFFFFFFFLRESGVASISFLLDSWRIAACRIGWRVRLQNEEDSHYSTAWLDALVCLGLTNSIKDARLHRPSCSGQEWDRSWLSLSGFRQILRHPHTHLRIVRPSWEDKTMYVCMYVGPAPSHHVFVQLSNNAPLSHGRIDETDHDRIISGGGGRPPRPRAGPQQRINEEWKDCGWSASNSSTS